MNLLTDSLRNMGFAGFLATAIFISSLIWAACINLRGLGLKHRLAFFPATLIPIMIGIGKCSADYARKLHFPLLSEREREFGMFWEQPLGIVMITTIQTALLLVVGMALLLQRQALAKDLPESF